MAAPQSDIADWLREIPIITRYWFLLSIAVPILGKIGLLPPTYLILIWEAITKLQIWRFITCFFYYPVTPMTGFHYLINLFFLYSYSIRLENGTFEGRPADYLLMLLVFGLCLIVAGLLVSLPILMDPLIIATIYVFCQLNPEMIVTFFFGIQFQARYLPWILTLFHFVTQGSVMMEIMGILVGHIYFFLKFKYPVEFGGKDYLQTPQFLLRYLPGTRLLSGGFGRAPARNQDPRGQWDAFQGHGQRLGNN